MAGSGTYVDVQEGQFHPDAPWNTVHERFDLSADYANTAYTTTKQYMEELNNFLQALSSPDTEGIGDIEVPEILPMNYIQRPKVSSLELDVNVPAFTGERPVFDNVPAISAFNMPVIGFQQPQWVALEKPMLDEIPAPGDAPSVVSPIVPTMPNIKLPSAPNLSQITIPAAPQTIVPSFDAIKPSAELILPEPFAYNEPIYQSDVWTELMVKILNDLRNGGTGLAIDVEEGIWQRLRLRLREERRKSARAVELKFGPSGFDLPQGAFASAMLEIDAEWIRGLEEQGYKISEEQARLALDNSKFIVEQGIKCESIVRQFFNDQNNRILESSKQVALVGIEVFKASVSKYNADVDMYKAEAAVFESLVRAAQQEIELFKSKVEAAKVSAEVQDLLVSIYQKQIEAVEAQVRIYATQLEGAKIQADVNLAAIQGYKVSVDAYVARLGGNDAKLKLYVSELDAEKTKAEIYKVAVDAFSAEVGAESKRTDANIAIADNTIKQNLAKIDVYKSDLLAYNTELDALLKALSAKVTGFEAEVSAYNAETQAEASYYGVKEAEIKVNIEAARFKLEKAVAEIKAVTDSYTSLNSLRLEGVKGLMDVSAQLTASALSACHASASVGYNSSESLYEGWSHSDGINESHAFNETPGA